MAVSYLGTATAGRCFVAPPKSVTVSYDPNDAADIVVGIGHCIGPGAASSATWAGAAMSSLTSTTGTRAFYKTSPTVTSSSLVIEYDNDGAAIGGAIGLSGCKTTGPIGQTGTGTGTGTAVSITLNGCLAGSMLFLAWTSGSGVSSTWGASQTEIWDGGQSGGCEPTNPAWPGSTWGGASYQAIASGGNYTLTATLSGSATWYALAFEVVTTGTAYTSSVSGTVLSSQLTASIIKKTKKPVSGGMSA